MSRIHRTKICVVCEGGLSMEILREFPDGQTLAKIVALDDLDYPHPHERINDVWCETCLIRYRVW